MQSEPPVRHQNYSWKVEQKDYTTESAESRNSKAGQIISSVRFGLLETFERQIKINDWLKT